MNRTFQYAPAQCVTNFDSAYNSSLKCQPQSTTYIPMSSSCIFSTCTNRSSSPLFRRSVSPPPRRPISPSSGPKFNFDLYKMNEINDKYDDYYSPSYRSISPPLSPSRIIHHYPIRSPVPSPTSESQTLSKLRRVNDELCQTLARTELTDRPSASPPHYHIHHYPLSQHLYEKHPSRSPCRERRRSIEYEVSPKIHKARVTYKIHIPRPPRQEQQHQKSSRHVSPSDAYSSDEPMVVDLYPTRDQGFVKQIRKHSDNQSPWVVDGTSVRRSSYSDTNRSRPPKGPYYGDKPIKSNRRSNRDKERPSSSSRRPDSAPLNTSDQFHESNDSYSNTTPVWRSNGTIKRPKFIDSPSSKRRTWQPPSKNTSDRPPKYFAPNQSNGEHIIDEAESEPIPQRKASSNRATIRSDDPKFKKRIANTESKVKSAWEPSVTSLTQSNVKDSKPPKSKVKSDRSEPTNPATATNTGRSSLNDVPSKPIFESTPRNENDKSVDDLFENESDTSEPSKKTELPRQPPPREEIPVTTPQQPIKPATEPPKTTVPEPDKGTKSTIKEGVLVRGDDTTNARNQNPTPTLGINHNNDDDDEEEEDEDDEASDANNAQPTPPQIPINQQKTPSPSPNNKDNVLIIDKDDEDENDQEVANSFDIHKWLNDASKAILGPSENGGGGGVIPSIPPKPQPEPKPKSPPRRKEQPPSPPVSDENLYKPPFGPKRADKKPASSPPPPPPPSSVPPPATTTAEETDEGEDFFS